METSISSPPTTANIPGRARGTATPTANGVASTFLIPHGLGSAPSYVAVMPKSALSAGLLFATADATNITVTYLTPPTAGTLSLNWVAEL